MSFKTFKVNNYLNTRIQRYILVYKGIQWDTVGYNGIQGDTIGYRLIQ